MKTILVEVDCEECGGTGTNELLSWACDNGMKMLCIPCKGTGCKEIEIEDKE